MTVSENLNLNLGNVETEANKLYLFNKSIASLDYSSSTDSRVIGKFERGADASGNYLFPIGSNATYNPLNLTLNTSPAAGSVLSEYFEGDPGGAPSFPILDNDVEVYEQYPDGYWGLKAENSFASNDYNLRLKAEGFENFHEIASIIKRPVGGDWDVDGGHKDASGLEAYRDTLRKGIDNTMGNHFTLGHTRPRIWIPPIDTIVCDGDVDFFSVAATGRGNLTYQWLEDNGSGWNPLSDIAGVYSGTTDSILTIHTARDSMDAFRYMVDVGHKYDHLKESDSVELWVNLLALQANVTDPLCDNIYSYGSIDALTTGGSSDYNYKWKAAVVDTAEAHGIATDSTFLMDNLFPGYVEIWVTDSIGCKTYEFNEVLAGENPVATPSIPKFGSYNISCADSSNGAIYIANINGKGGSNPNDYTFAWFDNPNPYDTMFSELDIDSLSGLSPGNYRVVITDTIGCYFEGSWIITEPPSIEIIRDGVIYPSGFDISCFNESDGIIDLNILNLDALRPIPTYEWVASNGGVLNQTDQEDISNVPAGTYDFTVTDVFGCFADTTYTLVSPTQIIAALIDSSDYNAFEISCNSLSDAYLDISTTGGFGGYDDYVFEWLASNGGILNQSDQEDIFNVPAGTYTLSITDSINCSRSFDYVLSEPDSLSIDPILSDFNNFNISCFNGSNGWITLQPDGGVVAIPYNYSWTGPGAGLQASIEDQADLSAGVYNVVLTDDNGCNENWDITLTEPDILASIMNTTSISCFSNATGAVDLEVSGGIEAFPYDYLWTPGGETSEDLNSLTVGEYSVIITDANNCEHFDTTNVPEPPDIIIELTSPGQYNGKMITCFGESDATINSHVYGGVGDFDYRWLNDAQTTTGLSNVPAGWYYLEITDDNECVEIDSIEVTQPLIMTTEVFETDPSCYTYNDGFITIIPQGGTPTYTILWDETEQTGQKADSITAGTYNVSITDLNNCKIDTFGILSQPDSMYIIKDITQPYCPDTRDGIIDLEIFGGTYPYTLNWSEEDKAGQYLEDLTEGTYVLEIVDNNLCVYNDTSILRGVNVSCLFIPTAFTPDGDGYNEVWEIGLIEIYPEAIIEIYNRWGTLIYVSDKGYTNPWDGTYKGRQMPIDSYYFVLLPGPGKKPVTGNVTIIR